MNPSLGRYGMKTIKTSQPYLTKGFILMLMALLFSGCSSWELKNRCEKTNWFDYGQDVAFNGKYLEEDSFVKDCKGVDRVSAKQVDLGFKLGRDKMCQYSEIYERGRTGVPVFFKFCDGLDPSKMKANYEKGLELFCTAENGQPYGRSGKVYQRVCPFSLEKKFLPTYYVGRREYLKQNILDLTAKISSERVSESNLLSSEINLSREIDRLPHPQVCKSIQVYDEATKKNEYRTICSEVDYIRWQRDRLYTDINQVRSSLYTVRNNIQKYNAELNESQSELTKIPLTDVKEATNTTSTKKTGG